jgi:hypothetical protein
MSTALRHRPLIAPTEQVAEGDCPCGSGPWLLNECGQVPEHTHLGKDGCRRRCPCSGWLARNPRPRKSFYVEGVQFL